MRLHMCLSHTATLVAIRKMGEGHDKLVLDWRDGVNAANSTSSTSSNTTGTAEEDNCESADQNAEEADEEISSEAELVPKAGKEIALRTDRTVSFIGDNFDTNIVPRDMRIDRQKTSLHLFHSCATVGRVDTLHLDDLNPSGDLPNLPISAFLPCLQSDW